MYKFKKKTGYLNAHFWIQIFKTPRRSKKLQDSEY